MGERGSLEKHKLSLSLPFPSELAHTFTHIFSQGLPGGKQARFLFIKVALEYSYPWKPFADPPRRWKRRRRPRTSWSRRGRRSSYCKGWQKALSFLRVHSSYSKNHNIICIPWPQSFLKFSSAIVIVLQSPPQWMSVDNRSHYYEYILL